MAKNAPTTATLEELELLWQYREQNRQLEAHLAHRKLARTSLEHFATFTRSHYRVNWHHRVICQYLERWYRGEIKNLAIFSPPQHGKSELVSRLLPAWILGNNPNAAVIATSYGAALACSMNRDVQRIIDSDEYKAVFPNTRLWSANVRTITKSGSRLRNADEFEVVDHSGYYRCAGVGGAITGRGFNYGIIDDPIKDRASAMSSTEREKQKDWYNAVFRTRKRNDDAGILLTLTRWHDDDLAGYILNLAQTVDNSDQWTVVCFPALCNFKGEYDYDPREAGEALWESRFSAKALNTTRSTIDPFNWSSVYQQSPNPAKGTVFAADWFKTYTLVRTNKGLGFKLQKEAGDSAAQEIVLAKDCTWFQTIDTAMSTKQYADFTVVGTFALTPRGKLLVYDVWRARVEIPHQFQILRHLARGQCIPLEGQLTVEEWLQYTPIPWPKQLLFQAVERASSGAALIQLGAAAGSPFKALEADASKTLRAAAISGMYANGLVYHRERATWLPVMVHELTRFPTGTHDDIVDVLAYAGILAQHDAILRSTVQGDLVLNDFTGRDLREAGRRVTVSTAGGIVDVDFPNDD